MKNLKIICKHFLFLSQEAGDFPTSSLPAAGFLGAGTHTSDPGVAVGSGAFPSLSWDHRSPESRGL